ncbi:MAG: YlbF family regulator [Acidobacteriota bacterium]
MNVYDNAHETARALKQSQQYLDYRAAREKLKTDASAWSMLNDFRSKQAELQEKIMTGEQPPENKIEEINRLFEIISQSGPVMEFMQTELALIRVVEDIQQILIKAVDLSMETEE